MKYYIKRVILFVPILLLVSFIFSCTTNNRQQFSSNSDSLISSIQDEYKLARSFQYDHQYSQAISHFKRCISFDSKETDVQDSLQKVVIDAMLQLMNTYQSIGEPEACVEYLDSIKNSTSVLDKCCSRDYYSILAYAISRAGDWDRSQILIDSVLSMPMHNSSPERLFRDYAYAAAIYFSDLKRQDDVIKWCNKAIEQGNLCKNTSGIQWITSLLATIYKRTGKIDEAIDMYSQALNEAQLKGDVLGIANALNSQTELYLYWNMPEVANICVSHALVYKNRLEKDNPMILGLSYIYKGRAMKNLNHLDSAVVYWQKAEECTGKLPYNSGKADVDFLLGTWLTQNFRGDSLLLGMKKLSNVQKNGIGSMKAKSSFELAKGYNKLKNNSDCDRMLDSMYSYLHLSETPQFIDGGYNFALKHYTSERNIEKTMLYAKALIQEDSIKEDSKITQKLVKTIVDFRTKEKENQLKLAEAELDNNNLRQKIYIFIIISILVISIVIYLYSKRVNKIQRQLIEQRFSSLLKDLEEVKDSKFKIENQLTDILSNNESRKKIEVVTPKLFQESGEMKFRERFEQLYPHFIPNLREKIPNVSRREELLCMLIVLGQDTFQIEQILCIAHSSVNMARYRLRQKMGLEKDESLEDIVKSFVN